ncbi:putative PurR-regulated permease PerM [Conyzicola lurida]|uniref:Putative PurR-regulated permease PerM n=1 Tax=Conyzicola lurida TaxID=1172621 RepID=A0A841AIM9_9MICO|nr:AI-2E family transporter [Conyzicola lurida]MBB5842304.1 putative PurR-regulated permease PerM [Conyzicola lurida]
MLFRARRAPESINPKPKAVATRDVVSDTLPDGMKIAGAWAWRLLAIVGVLVVFGLLVIQLRDIVIPLMIAVLIAALLVPVVQFLVRHRWPKALAVAVALLGAIVIVAGLIYLIVWQIRQGADDIQNRSITAYETFQKWLNTTFGIDSAQLNDYIEQAWTAIQDDSAALWSGALTVGTTAGHFLVGALLVLFATLFILIDGKGIWNWIVRLFPRKARAAVDGSGHAGWITLTTFVKVQIFVAFIDAVGIGLGAFILGLPFGGFPLVIPITIAVFLGSFIPVVGAVVTGTIAIFVALVYLGPIQALIMLGIVLLVQQVEGHILQPLVMGAAVKVHPLAVVFAVAAGSGVAGIIGALFAVPLVATLNVMVTYIASGKWRETTRPQLKEALKQ